MKTKIYPALNSVFTDMPKPLQEDDLDFSAEKEGEEEAEKEEQSKSFEDRLAEWKQYHIDELMLMLIP